ncbi:MAG: PIN domain-containing protein [Mycobacterium sp.]
MAGWDTVRVFTALLDTSVLWPSLQRDFLLSLAVQGLYRPAWSSAILEELEYHEAEKLNARGVAGDEAARRARRLVEHMRAAFHDAEVSGWEPLEGTFRLPDADDEHVVAAAVIARAGVIVTANLKDFPADLLPADLQALPAAEFVFNTVSVDPLQSMRAIREIAGRSGRNGPTQSVDDVLNVLEIRYGMADAVDLLRAHPELG